MRKIIAGIDLGSETIKVVVAEFFKNKFHVLAMSESPSQGIKKGLIVQPSEAVEAIKFAISQAEEMIGLKIKKVITNIPSNFAEFIVSEGSTTITNEDKLIKSIDIVRALQASVYNKIPDNKELVSVTPVEYYINEEEKVKEPKGLMAEKLTVKAVIITTPKKNVFSVLNCFEKLNIEVTDFVIGNIADYYTFKNSDLEKKVGIIINIGDQKTGVSVFNKGVLTNTEIIDIGGKNIDNDISFIYKINKNDSHYIKENLALANRRLASPSISEDFINKLNEKISLNQYEISEIVMTRLEEILELTKKQINLLTKKEISYIIVSGGLTEMPDFCLTLESVYGNNAAIGNIPIVGVRNNKFSTVVGIIKCFNEKLKLREQNYTIFNYEELEELGTDNKPKIANNSIVGKIFGYFFDN